MILLFSRLMVINIKISKKKRQRTAAVQNLAEPGNICQPRPARIFRRVKSVRSEARSPFA